MLRSLFLTCVASFLFLTCSFAEEADKDQTKNILVLFANTATTSEYRTILDGIQLKLSEEFGNSYNLVVEYLEIENYPVGKYPKEKFDLINEKFKDIKLDLLVCGGYNILPTIKANADSYLLGLPSILIDFDFSRYGLMSDLTLNQQTAVIGVSPDLGASISEALRLFPKASSVYFISGVSKKDSAFLYMSKIEAKKIEGLREISFINNCTMIEVLKKVSQLPENSIIFVSSFNTDSRGINYTNYESAQLICRSATAPVFTYSGMGLGDGAVGGYIMNFNKIKLLVGETTVKVLKGIDPKTIKFTEKDYYEHIFDWRELKRWNLENSAVIPKGSTFLYKETSFLGRYKWIIFPGIFVLILQTLLIIRLIRLVRKQKKMTEKILVMESVYKRLFRSERIMRIGQLTASLSHELNQPLSAILSTAQAGIRFIDTNRFTPALIKDLLQNIVEDDKRAASVLNSVRRMMKLEKRIKEKVDLNTLVREVVDLFQSQAIQVNSNVILKLEDVAVYIMADRVQIQQVLLNLISNASQAMEDTDIENKIITVSETVNDEFVTVIVQDNGTGITDTVKEKLFQPFITSRKEGLGIGLAISHSIIEDHNGHIKAENRPGGGAEFSFSLKIYHDE
jgi:signal transduction histidine kinase